MFVTAIIALAIGFLIAFKSLNKKVLILSILLTFFDLRTAKT